MRRNSTAIRLAAVAAACLLIAPAAGLAAAPGAGTAVWPSLHSDLPLDPAIRLGVLPNGMRYLIMRNATPAGQTSLRLRIGSGSLEESDDEQGLAHVLEHMAFKGSTHVPAGEMVKILQRKGLRFGPDTNAETEWTQTVYMLDLPHSDADMLDTGLMLMRETAGNLTLAPAALDTERGVVLSEERLRDTPEYRAEKAQFQLFLGDQLAARRFPIGTVPVVRDAPASLVRAFYEANYRPDRTTLIAVGDFDPDAMEARIKAVFGDWKATAPPPAEPDLGVVAHRGLTARVVALPGASTQVVIGWVRPYDASPDTFAKEEHETIENLALAVLNRRLSDQAHGPNPPFLEAGAAFQNLFHSAKIAVVQAVSPPAGWKGALSASEQTVRRLTTYGVTPAELAREITETRTGLQSALAGAETRPTATLAEGLVETVDANDVPTAPAEDLKVFEAAVEGVTPEKVDAALREIFTGAGPLVEVATPEPPPGGDAAVEQAFAQARATPLQAQAAQAAITWPYETFGAPGRVVSRESIPDLGVVTARFANGVVLTVKSTDFRKDQVLLTMNVGHGRLDLPGDRPTAAWASGALVPGGFGKISYEDARRALADKLVGVSFQVGDDAFVFGGATRPHDLSTQLQMFAAYLSDPGFRPEAFEHLRASFLSELPQLAATPQGVLNRDAPGLLAGGDPRWSFPSRSALETTKASDLAALLTPILAKGPVELTIVGDISADQAIALTAATIGALPTRAPVEPAAVPPGVLHFPAATTNPVLRTHTGRADQAVAVVAWPTTGFYQDMRASRAAMLAGDVLENRLLDTVRIAQGATYSPQLGVDLSQVFPDYGYALGQVEMPPSKIPGFYASVASLAADMREHGVTADELERARNPRIANLRRAQLTNEYWLADLAGAQGDPRHLALIRSTFPDYQALTAADLQAAARKVFVDDKAWKLVIEAEGAPKAP